MMATERLSRHRSDKLLFDRVILIPPQKNLLLHVSSDGFREWDESVGRRRPITLPSGTQLRLAVELDPSDNTHSWAVGTKSENSLPTVEKSR